MIEFESFASSILKTKTNAYDVLWYSVPETRRHNVNEEGCTEQEIAEGTCGYGVDGELGDEPAGPGLMGPDASLIVVKETLKNLLKKL